MNIISTYLLDLKDDLTTNIEEAEGERQNGPHFPRCVIPSNKGDEGEEHH